MVCAIGFFFPWFFFDLESKWASGNVSALNAFENIHCIGILAVDLDEIGRDEENALAIWREECLRMAESVEAIRCKRLDKSEEKDAINTTFCSRL